MNLFARVPLLAMVSMSACPLRLLVLVWLLTASVTHGTEPPKTRLAASDPADWKPVPYQVTVPTGSVTLDYAGLFRPVMENNIAYLLNSFSVNHMLVPFRLRAGQENPPDDRPQIGFWDTKLRGSSAGRFMMGAGNTLRWIEHSELRKRLNELIDGVEACREPNGYVLAYPPDKPVSEEPNYARAWFTHGLIEAAVAGNSKAYPLLRGHADWFNQWELLPKLIYWATNSHQGHIASTRTYFSPVGRPEDLQVAEKYYVIDWWMDELAARHEDAVWQYPLQDPHSYLITSFEAYLDHYSATGERRFLDSMLGAWDLIHDNWEHVGGSMAICETHWGWKEVDGKKERVLRSWDNNVLGHPPRSYYLTKAGHTGELCGSVFWIKFNQRFHQLYPEQEKYTAEIEKSLYNVCLANQAGGKGMRYHARMQGTKDGVRQQNSCCEGQGTRLYGSLPEYVYSIAADGLYVNLFEPSTIQWKHSEKPVSLKMTTAFPFEPQVTLQLTTDAPLPATIHVRIPSWAAADMPLNVNSQQMAVGRPGTYQAIERTWLNGDKITFTLPMDFCVTRYTGADQIAGHERYALEYGPILLAVVGPLGKNSTATIQHSPDNVKTWLKPKPEKPLCFAVDGQPEYTYIPYWQITDQTFCTHPIFDADSTKIPAP